MNDFDYDAYLKKKAGRGFFAQKKFHRSGCRLPHENLSRKEIASMSEEIRTVNLKKPMSYSEFKTIGKELQMEQNSYRRFNGRRFFR